MIEVYEDGTPTGRPPEYKVTEFTNTGTGEVMPGDVLSKITISDLSDLFALDINIYFDVDCEMNVTVLGGYIGETPLSPSDIEVVKVSTAEVTGGGGGS